MPHRRYYHGTYKKFEVDRYKSKNLARNQNTIYTRYPDSPHVYIIFIYEPVTQSTSLIGYTNALCLSDPEVQLLTKITIQMQDPIPQQELKFQLPL